MKMQIKQLFIVIILFLVAIHPTSAEELVTMR